MVTASPPLYYRLDMGRRRPAYNVNPTVPGSLGHFVRQVRESLGLSQEDFAELVGDNMSTSDVSRLELGNVGLPKPPRMIALARAMKLPVVELYVAAGYPEFREHVGNGRHEAHTDPELWAIMRRLSPERRQSYIRLIKEDLKGPPPDQLDEVDERADESAASA